MVQKMRVTLVEALKTFDMTCVIASLLLGSALSYELVDPAQLFGMRFRLFDIIVFFAYIIVYHGILCWHRLYVSRRLTALKEELIDILMATSVGTLLLPLFIRLLEKGFVPIEMLLIFWASSNAVLIGSRLVLRYTLKLIRLKGKNLRHIVIAGIHRRAILFAQEIVSRPELGYRLVGFVDDAGERTPEFEKSGYELVADTDNFSEFLRKQVVDEVMICLPVKSHYQQAANIAAICEEHGIMVRFLSDIFNPKVARSTVHQFEGRSVITLYTGHMTGGGVIVKRGMDFVLSLAFIGVVAPLFLSAALLVKLSSPGPVLFVQKRLGLNKRYFDVYKFRTMYSDAEQRQAELEHLNEVKGAAFKIKDDPRVTPIGKLLRKTSVDELPQLFNVLKGEMSLVGPRPLPIRDYEGFNKDWHRRRFSVRPGITCLWQISGRSNISFDRWMELDMEYIDTWSLWLDLKILLKTVRAVVTGSGAS